MKKNSLPNVCVVVSTYNWPKALEYCIRHLYIQTHLPNEIIVADDGSGPETQTLMNRLIEEAPAGVKVIHVWQEDKGFRLGKVRNKAFAKSCCEYIIQIDGDCIPEKHFVEDHLRVARTGYYVAGSRVLLPEAATKKILQGPILLPLRVPLCSMNMIRIPFAQLWLAPYYKQHNIMANRGGNCAFWKKDLIAVNGVDEDFEGWGHEDLDLFLRLQAVGIRKRFLKLGGVVFHLYHKMAERGKERENLLRAQQNRANGISRCKKGLDQYI